METEPDKRRSHWRAIAVRADNWIRKSPVMIGLLLITLVVSSLLTIAGGVDKAVDYYDSRVNWRAHEYDKLESLHAGFSLAKFEEVLGSPTFVRGRGQLQESIFQGRGYWVQAIVDSSGTVGLYAVTACNGFKPSFDTVVGTVTLNETTLTNASAFDPKYLRYFLSGATANSYFYDEYSSGNPTDYKTFYFGLNDACQDIRREREVQFLVENRLFGSNEVWAMNTELIDDFRSIAVMNTFAETAPFWPSSWDSSKNSWLDFQVGADRLLTRTVW